jgi:hypothetical protein
MKALDRDTERRFATALEFADALEKGARVSSNVASNRDVAECVERIVGSSLSQQREVVRSWLSRSEPGNVRRKNDSSTSDVRARASDSVTRIEGGSKSEPSASTRSLDAVDATHDRTSLHAMDRATPSDRHGLRASASSEPTTTPIPTSESGAVSSTAGLARSPMRDSGEHVPASLPAPAPAASSAARSFVRAFGVLVAATLLVSAGAWGARRWGNAERSSTTVVSAPLEGKAANGANTNEASRDPEAAPNAAPGLSPAATAGTVVAANAATAAAASIPGRSPASSTERTLSTSPGRPHGSRSGRPVSNGTRASGTGGRPAGPGDATNTANAGAANGAAASTAGDVGSKPAAAASSSTVPDDLSHNPYR